METNWPWNWRLTARKTIKVSLVRPPMTSFKMTVRADCAVSACSPFPLAHWLSVGRVNLWTGPALLYPVASIHSKASFPFHQPCLFIGFWWVGSRTQTLSITVFGASGGAAELTPGFSWIQSRPGQRAGMAARNPCSWLTSPGRRS